MEGYIFTNNLRIVAWHKSPWHMFRSASYWSYDLKINDIAISSFTSNAPVMPLIRLKFVLQGRYALFNLQTPNHVNLSSLSRKRLSSNSFKPSKRALSGKTINGPLRRSIVLK